MRFVPPKGVDQQGRLMVHRAWQGFVEQRTATLNRIRGLLAELGIVLPLKAATVRSQAAARLEDRRRPRVQQRAAAQRVAVPGARAVQLGRQDPAGRITKAGDTCLSSRLIMGARGAQRRPGQVANALGSAGGAHGAVMLP
jgi:transposase